jgi:hypothetical protein
MSCLCKESKKLITCDWCLSDNCPGNSNCHVYKAAIKLLPDLYFNWPCHWCDEQLCPSKFPYLVYGGIKKVPSSVYSNSAGTNVLCPLYKNSPKCWNCHKKYNEIKDPYHIGDCTGAYIRYYHFY